MVNFPFRLIPFSDLEISFFLQNPKLFFPGTHFV